MISSTDLELKSVVKIRFPKKYKVYLLNDDYTSMDFVVDILMNIFHKSSSNAQQIMLEIHQKERGLCGIYTHEIAETKIMQVHKKARESGFPLKAIMEEE